MMPTSFWTLLGWAYVAFMIAAVVAFAVDSAERRFGVLGAAAIVLVCVSLASFIIGLAD